MQRRSVSRARLALLLAASSIVGGVARADVRITEWMYSGPDGEFFELTNVGTSPVDLSGWSYDDVNNVPGAFPIGSIGVLLPGESAIVTEASPTVFRAAWSLPPSVKIVGFVGLANANNMGRNDAINLFDANGVIVEKLVYGDQAFPGSIRTQNKSGWTQASGLGANNPLLWQFSVPGDAQGSVVATTGEPGSPGSFTLVGGSVSGLGMTITEWMYDGPSGEFVEFTNLSSRPIDMTGWRYDDSNMGNGAIGPFDLSAFGVVQPGESVVLTEANAATFRAAWGIAPGVKIVGGLGATTGNNLGRNDQINVYDASGTLADRLTYGDETFPGSIRTQNFSGWTATALGANDVFGWQLSSIGDEQGTIASTGGSIGNPGVFVVPPSFDPADLDQNRSVDGADLAILLGQWGGTGIADIDDDGVVGGSDLAILLGAWTA